jgi:hypothetical protein
MIVVRQVACVGPVRMAVVFVGCGANDDRKMPSGSGGYVAVRMSRHTGGSVRCRSRQNQERKRAAHEAATGIRTSIAVFDIDRLTIPIALPADEDGQNLKAAHESLQRVHRTSPFTDAQYRKRCCAAENMSLC